MNVHLDAHLYFSEFSFLFCEKLERYDYPKQASVCANKQEINDKKREKFRSIFQRNLF